MKPPQSMEPNALSEEDETTQQEKIAKHLKMPTVVEEFVRDCKNIGQTAVAVDGHFKTVRAGLTELVKKYGRDFPDVQQVHVPKWNSFMNRWDGKEGLLWSSRSFASKTVAALKEFDLILGLIMTSKDNTELQGMQKELRVYVDRHPVDSATHLADGFKDLSRDVGDFAKTFTTYMKEQGQTLTKEAEMYEEDMARCQADVDKFNKKIEGAAKSLSCAGIFAILAVIPLINFIKLVNQGKEAVAKRNKAKANLADVARKQQSLAAMQADFEKFKPNIDDICFKLGIFAGIWAFVTSQSVQIDASLDEGMSVVTKRRFTAKLDALRAQIVPLKEGLEAYTAQIVPRSNT